MIGNGILIVIPARGGSKRLPGKNLRQIGGRSLIAWTAQYLADEGLLGSAILSTDDEVVAEEGRKWSLSVPFIRPAELSTDAATTFAAVIHALEHNCRCRSEVPEMVAVLQVTSPFRRPGLLRDAIALLRANPSAGSVVAMSRLHVVAKHVYSAVDNSFVEPIGKGLASALVPSGSLYLARTPELKAQESVLATPILAIEVSGGETIDIDTEDDLRLAEAQFLLESKQSGSEAR